jgi:uroporphyrinogen-III synthase|tara:strand:+ start:6117 stop:6866 length:750 start_codon:yes stop_codon:yes gene_type:complete
LKKRIKVLIAQPVPSNVNSPFHDLAKKQNLNIVFNPFLSIEGETVKNIRLKKISIPKYTSLILTSRNAVNHYFRICDEMRITVPNSMKYFCISEAVSYYLQKYIAYRKRKIYSSNNNFDELIELMEKHEDEKFLLVSSNFIKESYLNALNKSNIEYTRGEFFKTVSTDLSKVKINTFDIMVFYSPRDIDSLYENFPKYEQKNTKIAVFGEATNQAAVNAGLNIDIQAPNTKYPSMSMALEAFLKENKLR